MSSALFIGCVFVQYFCLSDASTLHWYAPFYSGGGYCSEALDFVHAAAVDSNLSVSIYQHGDGFNHQYVSGMMSSENRELLYSLDGDNKIIDKNHYHHQDDNDNVFENININICHSEPGAWSVPHPRYRTAHSCPPAAMGRRSGSDSDSKKKQYNIGRTMFETNTLPSGWADRINWMDEVWVPTEFARRVFVDAGVDAAKVRVVPEPVDTDLYHPVDLVSAAAVLTRSSQHAVGAEAGEAVGDTEQQQQLQRRVLSCAPSIKELLRLKFAFASVSKTTSSSSDSDSRSSHSLEVEEDVEDNETKKHFNNVNEKSNKQNQQIHRPVTVFLFVGKWEARKGIRELVSAFLAEFCPSVPPPSSPTGDGIDSSSSSANTSTSTSASMTGTRRQCAPDVQLLILSSQYHSSEPVSAKLQTLLGDLGFGLGLGFSSGPGESMALPPIKLLENIHQEDMPVLYSLANAVVIPSFGEGWGRPHVEALACGTPVIATNWSGVTAYLTEENGYPVAVEKDLVASRDWKGHSWAAPVEASLRRQLRAVYEDHEGAAHRGRRGRVDMVERFSVQAMGAVLSAEIRRIEAAVTVGEEIQTESEQHQQRVRQGHQRPQLKGEEASAAQEL